MALPGTSAATYRHRKSPIVYSYTLFSVLCFSAATITNDTPVQSRQNGRGVRWLLQETQTEERHRVPHEPHPEVTP